MKIVSVVGARPQIIKSSVVSAAFVRTGLIDEVLVHTGQHFDDNMSGIFFEELGLAPPRYNLGIGGGTHGQMTGRMLAALEQVFMDERPDAALVYGDTNSTVAGALAAAKLHVPVAHVEAGLRSYNMRMPEEINRVLTDRISTWHFAPTEDAVANLRREGIADACIFNVGDVMFDVALRHGERANALGAGVVDSLGLAPRGYALVTVHRAENTDDGQRMRAIVEGLRRVAAKLPVVWPLHPRTRGTMSQLGLLSDLPAAIRVVEPQGYLDMVRLEQGAAVIVTDSGGVQKEAFFHGVPCVTLREETEWVELVAAGWNRLATPLTPERMAELVLDSCGRKGEAVAPYGTGNSANLIAAILTQEGR